MAAAASWFLPTSAACLHGAAREEDGLGPAPERAAAPLGPLAAAPAAGVAAAVAGLAAVVPRHLREAVARWACEA